MTLPTLEELPVGQRVRWARKNAGLTLDALAALMPTTRQVIIKWEKGKHLPNRQSRERLAEITGQAPDLFAEHLQHDLTQEDILQRQAAEMIAPFPGGNGGRAASRVPSTRRRKGGS